MLGVAESSLDDSADGPFRFDYQQIPYHSMLSVQRAPWLPPMPRRYPRPKDAILNFRSHSHNVRFAGVQQLRPVDAQSRPGVGNWSVSSILWLRSIHHK